MTNSRDAALTEETVELLQQLIRNACVNDGTPESGQEVRNADTLQSYLHGVGLDVQRYEPTPGRVSLVSRIEGSDPDAPSLCLMGHTDVVPVNESGWTRDPFAGERITTGGVDEVWGRGAVDMLNLTASMAAAFRALAASGFRPKGDLILFAVADEESGSAHGMRWMADNERDAIMADYVLTENGGLHSGSADAPSIAVTVAEKGVAWRRLRIRGVPGHGSMPYRRDNALVTAAGAIQRLTDYAPPATVTELWREQVDSMGLDAELTATLLDPSKIDAELATMPAATASFLHACTHTTFSCNVLDGGLMKTNVIPDSISLDVDVRTLPGESEAEVRAHLDSALGDFADRVEVEALMNDRSSISQIDTPLWDAIADAVAVRFPTARITPRMSVGFTDARIYREMGAVAYGAGLLSPALDAGAFGSRFHGNDERIDVESLALTTQFWLDTIAAL
jgi:acetylornithine deacetylase/succinyl-diaminopimelate desuccinylase-like protein